MKKWLIYGLIAVLLSAFAASAFVGCSSSENEIIFRVHDEYVQWKYSDSDGWNNLFSVADLNESGALSGKSAYDIAVSQGFEGSEEEWIASLVGDNGQSVRIGENGNWFIGENDTGVSAYGMSSGNVYAVPNFTRKGVEEIQLMPEYDNFLIVYHGEIKDNFVMSQSIPAGVIVAQGTKIDLYMYEYFVSDEAPTDSNEDVPTEEVDGTPTEEYELTISYVSQKRSPGKKASIIAQGKPNTSYSIEVMYLSGPSQSKDLVPKMSDDKGEVEWTWTIGVTTQPGKYAVIISDGVKTVTTHIEIVEE